MQTITKSIAAGSWADQISLFLAKYHTQTGHSSLCPFCGDAGNPAMKFPSKENKSNCKYLVNLPANSFHDKWLEEKAHFIRFFTSSLCYRIWDREETTLKFLAFNAPENKILVSSTAGCIILKLNVSPGQKSAHFFVRAVCLTPLLLINLDPTFLAAQPNFWYCATCGLTNPSKQQQQYRNLNVMFLWVLSSRSHLTPCSHHKTHKVVSVYFSLSSQQQSQATSQIWIWNMGTRIIAWFCVCGWVCLFADYFTLLPGPTGT